MPPIDLLPTVAVFFVAIMAVVTFIEKVLNIWRKSQKSPSVEEELKTYVLKIQHDKDIAECRAHMFEKYAELKKENENQWAVVNGERQTMRRTMEDMNRALGRIEGKVDVLQQNGGAGHGIG